MYVETYETLSQFPVLVPRLFSLMLVTVVCVLFLMNIHRIVVTITVSVILPFVINIKVLFWTFGCFSKKK